MLIVVTLCLGNNDKYRKTRKKSAHFHTDTILEIT